MFVSKNVSHEDKDIIAQSLGVNTCLGTGLYLGLPSMIGCSKKSLFKLNKDKIWKKNNSWGGRSLSKAGKKVIIKSVLQSIRTYFMSLFLLPSSIEDEIQSLINGFWWGCSGARRSIQWLLVVCVFRNLYVFSVALLGKQEWRLLNNPNSLVEGL